jgi:hypothetical protein
MRQNASYVIVASWAIYATAEEIGDAVGLSRQSLEKDELPQLLENIPKVAKVHFSEPDWNPPIYNVWAYQGPRESLQLGMQTSRYFQKTKKKAGHQRTRE